MELNKNRYHDMDKARTLNLISACDIEIPIFHEDYSYVINGYHLNEFSGLALEKENEICNMFEDSKLKEKFRKRLHMSILPDYINNNFFIGYSPNEIINTIFDLLDVDKTLNIDSKIKLDYANQIEFMYQATEAESILWQYIQIKEDEYKFLLNKLHSCTTSYDYLYLTEKTDKLNDEIKFATSSLNNSDKIFDLYNDRTLTEFTTERFDEDKNRKEKDYHISWRNLAQYIAIMSLRQFDRTKDMNYLIYPYKFYEKCTKPDKDGNTMLWVSELLLEDDILDTRFIRYNYLCENTFKKNPLTLEFLLEYKDNNKFTVFDTINPTELIISNEHFGDLLEYKAHKSRVGTKKKDIDKTKKELIAEKQFLSKINFYSHNSEFGKHVVARMYLNENNKTGFVGFILDNDYIVLDKFFNESKTGICKPATDSAVFAMPLDIYYNLTENNIKITTCVNDEDKHIIHKYHRDSNSYQDAILKLVKEDSISRLNATQFITKKGGKIPFNCYNENSKKKTKKYKNNNKTN